MQPGKCSSQCLPKLSVYATDFITWKYSGCLFMCICVTDWVWWVELHSVVRLFAFSGVVWLRLSPKVYCSSQTLTVGWRLDLGEMFSHQERRWRDFSETISATAFLLFELVSFSLLIVWLVTHTHTHTDPGPLASPLHASVRLDSLPSVARWQSCQWCCSPSHHITFYIITLKTTLTRAGS